MNATYVPQAIAAGARLYATCRVDRIETKGGRAVGVRGSFRHPFAVDPAAGTGKVAELHVRARKAVIVACSAIQTPILLGKNGIGKRSKMLGRRLQTHPGTGVSGVFDEPVKMWFGATQGHESVHWWDERMKLETVGMPLELGAVRLPGFGAGLVDKLADFGHVTMWGVQVRAETHGRVKRGLSGRTVIKYDMGVRDVQRMKIGVKRLTELQFAAGARAVYPGVHGLPDRIESVDEINAIDNLPDDPRLFHCIMAHLFGTAVMGTDPRTSVVDPSLQTHDLEGLYVFDSSVFPTNMGVNPQHSICAMSWLAAEKLRSEL